MDCASDEISINSNKDNFYDFIEIIHILLIFLVMQENLTRD